MITALTPMEWKRRAIKYYPDKIAVIDDDDRYTYRELGQRINRLSHALRGDGIGKGDHVAVILPNIHEMIECFFGIGQLGAVVVPLNYRLNPDDFAYILNHSDAKLLILDAEYAAVIEQIRDRLPGIRQFVLVSRGAASSTLPHIEYEQWLSSASPDDPPAVDIDENQTLTINYTSGTTSRPKGVMLTHRNNYLNAANFLYHLQVVHDDMYLHTLPLFHVNGWGGVWATTGAGATHVCLRKVDPARIISLFNTEKITLLCGAPTVLNMMVNAKEASEVDRSIPRRMAVAGSPPPAAVLKRAHELLALNVIHVYGMTETSPFITYCEWNHHFDSLDDEQKATVRARQGIEQMFSGEVRVVSQEDPTRDVRWDGQEIGEIVTRGNAVMAGYYKQPEETAKTIIDGWLHTGDLAVVHPDGYIEILDRKKDIIISGGENISSTEVEGVIYQHPAILEAAVIAVPDEKWGEVPKALVVVKPGFSLTELELIEYCRERLAHFKAPKSVEFVESLPRTATGKLQKFKLREAYWKGARKRVQ
ncbi:MAG: long-chain-fatty-acid--CoA ligase [Kyrpidia tusciae]|nr:long-chain-fatty-acid--CoA ligase [Kyrpidia tusciae]MBE3553090.1 long-chain-fatty-acid--CoA ligase [Kyrpidia tusciae]